MFRYFWMERSIVYRVFEWNVLLFFEFTHYTLIGCSVLWEMGRFDFNVDTKPKRNNRSNVPLITPQIGHKSTKNQKIKKLFHRIVENHIY